MRVSILTLLAVAVATAGCCHVPCKNNLPPAQMLMHPGPGVDGPGPGVMMYQPGIPTPQISSQMAFIGPEGMSVIWDVMEPGQFDSEPLICPARYNFPQGAIYQLKITNIPGRPGVELYPTLEVGPAMPRSEAFLAHNAIPVQFTEEDFDQVLSGNFVTKVIYLPDPEFQELAVAGVETLVSTRLDPGVDPIVEADRRGAILAIVRIGNKDLQLPAPADIQQGDVKQVGYSCPMPSSMIPGGQMPGGSVPMGMAVGGPNTMPNSNYISGVTMPQYGMPMCGTPIGLPGPPHVPLGVPAGLQKNTIVNHTRVNLPGPTEAVRIDVKQKPGLSYPKPVDHVRIVERADAPAGLFRPSSCDRHEQISDPPCVEGQARPVGGGNSGAYMSQAPENCTTN
ncbi:MAG: hypothetical protein ABSG67_09155 [Thermoguttaceae bacterium]